MSEKVRIRQAVAPAVEPVSVSQVKGMARIIGDENDTIIAALITTARMQLERVQGRAYIEQTFNGYLGDFCNPMILPRPPLIAVSKIEYLDTAGTLQTLDPANYLVDSVSEPGEIFPAYGFQYPETARDPNAVKITYTAGYGAEPWQVPMNIKQAINMLSITLFDNPSMTGQRDTAKLAQHIYYNLLSADRNFRP